MCGFRKGWRIEFNQKEQAKMKVKREEFLSIVNQVQPGISTREEIEQADHVVFDRGMAFTFNDQQAVMQALPEPLKELKGAVPAQALLDSLAKLGAEELDVKQIDGHLCLLTKRSQTRVTLASEIRLPLEQFLGGTFKWWTPPDSFWSGLSFCLPMTSTDATLPLLTCVHVKGTMVEACDRRRLAQFDFAKGGKGPDFLIPRTALALLPKFPKFDRVGFDGRLLCFAQKGEGGPKFFSRTFVEKYPDLARYAELSEKEVIGFPEDLPEALERAEIFAVKEFDADSSVEVWLRPGGCQLRAENAHGDHTERMGVDYKGMEAKFFCHPRLLREMVGKKTEVFLAMSKEEGTANRIAITGENWRFVASVAAPSGE